MRVVALGMLLLIHSTWCWATSGGTFNTALTELVADAVEMFCNDHQGALPVELNDLKPYLNFEGIEITHKRPLPALILLLSIAHAKLDQPENAEIIAATAFPIDPNTGAEIGRHAILRTKEGKIVSRWIVESRIQEAMRKVNGALPPADVFKEKARGPGPEYTARLLEDAVIKHGVSMEEAKGVIEQHLKDLKDGRTGKATLWSEITPADGSERSVPSKSGEVRVSVTQQLSRSWVAWVAGIGALVSIAVWLMRRKKQPY